MNNNNTQDVGNVILVDPNTINSNPSIENSVPKYEDMFIYVDLVAERRGRTVLTTTGVGTTTSINDNSTDGTIKVNLMGFNQNKDINEGSFTTNFYDDGDPTSVQYESFGITNIDISVNSSYVPQINVEFTDIRGLSFFNKKNSPYRILFDFPPPIFTLKVKGYYGMTLEYKMHLVKHTTEFKPENGNYIIGCEFIALTYAPLTDVLFRYVINSALITLGDTPINPDSSSDEQPRCTYELISRLRNLYSDVERTKALSGDEDRLNNIIENIARVNNDLSKINTYRTNDELNSGKQCRMFLYDRDDNDEINRDRGLVAINSTNDYNVIITSFGVDGLPSNISTRLLIGFEAVDDTGISSENFTFRNKLAIFRDNVLELDSSIQTTNLEWDNKTFIVLDLTEHYINLYKQRVELVRSRNEQTKELNDKINDIVVNRLGMKPTIYNIFKLILDDVDEFFRQLRITSENAEISHNDPSIRNKILSSGEQYKDVGDISGNNKIYSFPLIINERDGWCNAKERVRTSPSSLGENIGYVFPEMQFVDNFINSFKLQSQLDVLNRMRLDTDESNNNKWIPFSPIDSSLLASAQSPYARTIFGGGNLVDSILDVLIKRFYIKTQYALNSLYLGGENKDLIKFYVEAEALNLSLSLVNENSISLMVEQTNRFKNNINDFYGYIENNLPDLFDLSDNKIPFPDNDLIGGSVQINKNNENFKGLFIYNDDITILSGDSMNELVSEYFDTNKSSLLRNWFSSLFSKDFSDYVSFTNENLMYIKDGDTPQNNKSIYLTNRVILNQGNSDEVIFFNERLRRRRNDAIIDRGKVDKVLMIDYMVENEKGSDFFDSLIDNGNIETTGGLSGLNYEIIFNSQYQLSIDDQLSRILKQYNFIINDNTLISELIIFSFAGLIQNPLTQYPKRFNRLIFNKPGVVQIPRFVLVYLGLMSKMVNENRLNEIVEFTKTMEMVGNPLSLIADYFDVKNHLSKNDKDLLITYYDGFKSSYYGNLVEALNSVYGDGSNNIDTMRDLMKNNHGASIIDALGKKINLLINSTITFNKDSGSLNQPTSYVSISQLRSNNVTKTALDGYFRTFFTKLSGLLSEQKQENNNREKQLNKIANDEDIRTQTYYSFKNINDKWLSGTSGRGYPFMGNNKPLIESFAFVNRAMHPIGDTVINPELLLDVIQDPNISIYSVLSQILSTNGFEFFPLQNFMSHAKNDWTKSFKLDTSGKINTSPVFVCMYIGGSSSYPSYISTYGNNFYNDGITDMSDLSDTDFMDVECDGDIDPIEQNVHKDNGFTYSQVRAFRVRYGEQNQSMFTDFKVDSKEYPETNESIQILSRIVGDGGVQAPIPKGQNLYNLYENRSYSATITSFGNVCIQPTQYFQLENVPLYNGAYVILDVKHNIKPNHMMTTFTGTKILKYPMPRVKEIATVFGFDGGTSDDSSGGGSGVRPAYNDAELGEKVVRSAEVDELIRFI